MSGPVGCSCTSLTPWSASARTAAPSSATGAVQVDVALVDGQASVAFGDALDDVQPGESARHRADRVGALQRTCGHPDPFVGDLFAGSSGVPIVLAAFTSGWRRLAGSAAGSR
jgi:hypothetical protein